MEAVKRTWNATTQLALHVTTKGSHKEHLKARYPQLNHRRVYETYEVEGSETDVAIKIDTKYLLDFSFP